VDADEVEDAPVVVLSVVRAVSSTNEEDDTFPMSSVCETAEEDEAEEEEEEEEVSVKSSDRAREVADEAEPEEETEEVEEDVLVDESDVVPEIEVVIS